MGVNLYRLYAVQSFKGQKVAVYVDDGNFPDAEILSDAQDILDGRKTRGEVIKGNYIYNSKYDFPVTGSINRARLTYFTRVIKRSQKVIEKNGNIDKAIFVSTTNKRDWRGEKPLYENTIFDAMKCDTPEYTGCKLIGTIII